MMVVPLKYYKYIRLIINFFLWISLGAMNDLLGPTIPDLSIRVAADYQVLGSALTARIAASLITPFIVGFVFDRYPSSKGLGLGVLLVSTALSSIAIPYCRNIWTLGFAMSLQGFFIGGMTVPGQSLIIELFKARAVSALQFMHLGWGVGNFLATAVLRPFLSENLRLSNKQVRYSCLINSTTISNLSYLNNYTTANATRLKSNTDESKIEYAFIIVSAYAIVMSIITILFSFLPQPQRVNDKDSKRRKNLKEMLGPTSISDGKPKFGVFMLASITLIYALDVGAYATVSTYFVTIAIDPCKPFSMTQRNATLLQGIRAVCFSCSRIIFGCFMMIFVKRIQPGIVMAIYSIGTTISMALLMTAGFQHEIAFWIFGCTYAFFHAPFYGGCTPWFNQYIRVTSSVISLAIIGAAVGKMFDTWLGGYILKTLNSKSFLFSQMGFVSVVTAIVISVVVVSMQIGKRPSFKRYKESDVEMLKNNKDQDEDVVDEC